MTVTEGHKPNCTNTLHTVTAVKELLGRHAGCAERCDSSSGTATQTVQLSASMTPVLTAAATDMQVSLLMVTAVQALNESSVRVTTEQLSGAAHLGRQS